MRSSEEREGADDATTDRWIWQNEGMLRRRRRCSENHIAGAPRFHPVSRRRPQIVVVHVDVFRLGILKNERRWRRRRRARLAEADGAHSVAFNFRPVVIERNTRDQNGVTRSNERRERRVEVLASEELPGISWDDERGEPGVSHCCSELIEVKSSGGKSPPWRQPCAVSLPGDLHGRGNNVPVVEGGRMQHRPQGDRCAGAHRLVLLLPRKAANHQLEPRNVAGVLAGRIDHARQIRRLLGIPPQHCPPDRRVRDRPQNDKT